MLIHAHRSWKLNHNNKFLAHLFIKIKSKKQTNKSCDQLGRLPLHQTWSQSHQLQNRYLDMQALSPLPKYNLWISQIDIDGKAWYIKSCLIYLFRIQMKIDTARRCINGLYNLQRAPNQTEKLSNGANTVFKEQDLQEATFEWPEN